MDNRNIISSLFTHRGFILAVSGAAVGIGSIWRMPYLIGEHGGSLFILFYLIFIVILGIPAMTSEILIGRIGRKPPVKSLQTLSVQNNKSMHWKKIAWLGTTASVLILSFYSVVSGWCVRYFFLSLSGESFNHLAQTEQIFNNLLLQPKSVLLYGSIFIGMTFFVSMFRINQGIEKLNDILMPLLYFILIILLVYAATLSGFKDAMAYLLTPKWHQINSSMLLTAMGMAFFTLATGACCLMAYGAYMPEKQSVLFSVSMVSLINISVILCAGIAIFSIVFSYGMNASSGPGLVFVALPLALSNMPFGHVILPILFFLLVIACWTSSVNLAEPIVSLLSDKLNSRKKGVVVASILIWTLSLIPCLSFNVFKNVKFFNKDLFTVYTGFATDILLPITGFFILVFAGYIIRKQSFAKGLGLSQIWNTFWSVIIRYISPLCLLCVFLSSLK